jgi:cytoskeletal protein CcmA (bactofilin family)
MNNRGIALISVYMLIMVLTILGSSFIARTIQEQRTAEYFANSTRAFWVAEAGLQQATRSFRNNDWNGWSAIDASTRRLSRAVGNSGNYEVDVVGAGTNSVTITSVGFAPDALSPGFAQRTVSVLYSRSSSLFRHAAFGNTGVSLLGNARTNSYDSRIGPYGGANINANGHVGTSNTVSGAITLTGSSRVNGDAETGPGGTVAMGWSCVVTGNLTNTVEEPASQINVPSELSGLSAGSAISLGGNSSQTLSSGNYRLPSISVTGNSRLTLDGDVNIYLTGSSALNVSGSGRLIINGTANIYIDGNATVTGAGIVNNAQIPSDFMLYGTVTSNNITISGSGDVYGGIYAPSSNISVTGNARLYGAAVGDTVSITGSSRISYDEALTGGASGGGDYVLRYWREDR